MPSASVAPIYASTGWKVPAATSLSDEQYRSGTGSELPRISSPGKPWLLRFFDQIRFYPVSAEQLLRHREDFLEGKFSLTVEEKRFGSAITTPF